MALFKCDNADCSNTNIIEKTGTLRLHWDSKREKYVSYFKCESCNDYLVGYREDDVDLDKVSSINKGAAKVSKDIRNTIY